MPFSFQPCPIEGLFEIQPKIFSDKRGFFLETWSERNCIDSGFKPHFVQDNLSRSVKGVLRGLHFQKKHPQDKLVWVIEGQVFDVAVDIRPGSPSRGKWYAVILSGDKQNQLYIPKGFAHGFLVMSEMALLIYKCTDFYHPEDEAGLLWNDPTVGINWPDLGMDFIISEKDKKLLAFNALE
jgi:dTDP-4-dehydrorhamnose 3,5-epimerase